MSDIIAAVAPAPNCSPCLHRVDESTSRALALIESTDFVIVPSPMRSSNAQVGEMDDHAAHHHSGGSASATSVFSRPAQRSLTFRSACSLDHPR